MKKLITFSLWGENAKYCLGAIRNAELAPLIYPGWKCRFYFGKLEKPAQDTPISGLLAWTIFKLKQMEHVECVFLDMPANWTGMFWRFYPASEDDVDVFISRDCDSRLSAREADAVNEWLANPQLVHSMGDHPYHFNPRMGLMGGMFGMKKHAFPQMKEVIDRFIQQYPDAWQCDQDFLKQHVFPLVAHKVYATSDIHPGCKPFPSPREGGAFVGEIIGPNEEILHPEHRAMRDA